MVLSGSSFRTSVTRGLPAGIICVLHVPPNGTFCERQLHKSSLGINLQIARTSVPQKNCFQIVCVIVLGLIALHIIF